MSITRLHFVYNVDATVQAIARDFVHRIVDPDTYPCRLCDLTYGRFVKKPGWQLFLWSLPVKSAFHMRNQFLRIYPELATQQFPAVLAEHPDGNFSMFMSAEDFQVIPSLDALKQAVHARLAENGQLA